MKLIAESTVFNDDKVQSKFAELVVDADGIRTEVGKKVGNTEVISRINQSAESVKIQAYKINIDGVITAVNDNTTTTIDGDKITTGTLLASAVKADSGTFNIANIPNLSADKIKTSVITAVNNSTETSGGNELKISANKVNIEGAAIFTSGRLSTTSLNAAYDANGAATGAVNTLTNDLASASGTTVINGGHIATESIGANKIKVNELTIGQSQVSGLSTALANTEKLYKHDVDLTSSSYNQNTWYPVLIGPCPSTDSSIYFKCSITGGGGTPSWSSHSTKHWGCEVETSYSVSAWGWKPDNNSYIDAYTFGQTSTKPIVLSNALSNSSYLVVYLRGGGYYPIQTNIADTPQIKTSSYTINSQTVAPTTTQPVNTSNFVISRREGDTKTDEAATKATSYITHIDDNGIRVHPSSTENNSVVINAYGMEMFKGGTTDAYSVAKYGDTARIGKLANNTARTVITGGTASGGMDVIYRNNNGTDITMAHIGYGNTNNGSSTEIAPYYTLGQRDSGYANGRYSVCEGYNCAASQHDCHAEGLGTKATGYATHSEGSNTVASGHYSHAEGYQTTASGYGSHASGYGTTAQAFGQTAIGRYNTEQGTPNTMIATDNAFIVGNGTSLSSTSNALALTYQGNMTIAGRLTQSSDIRLKTIIHEPVGDVSKIKAVKYKWKEFANRDNKEHIGYIAQEVEAIAPFLVNEDDNGYKTLDYIGLLCAKIDNLEKRIEELERREQCIS